MAACTCAKYVAARRSQPTRRCACSESLCAPSATWSPGVSCGHRRCEVGCASCSARFFEYAGRGEGEWMRSKRELQARVGELEQALEEAKSLIDEALASEVEEGDEEDED